MTVREYVGRIIALLFASIRYFVLVWYEDVSIWCGRWLTMLYAVGLFGELSLCRVLFGVLRRGHDTLF